MSTRVLDVGTSSDVGDIKKINENTILVKTNFVKNQEIGIFVVSQGEGENKKGKRASTMAIEMISFWWDKYFIKMMKNDFTLQDILNHLDNSIELINQQLNSKLLNSGATLSILIIIGDIYIIRHVGNTRIYVINKGIKQLTIDDSYGEEQLLRGEVRKDEAQYYINKKLISKKLGLKPNIDIYNKVDKIIPNDIFLLCNIGFYDNIVEPDILKIIYNNRIYSMQDKVHELRNLIQKGSADNNVSLILIKPINNKISVF